MLQVKNTGLGLFAPGTWLDLQCPVLLDIGTGDGRFVIDAARAAMAARQPLLAVGVDACRENLREAVYRAPENAVFVIANALALPEELSGIAARLTINFPWGSLRDGLLNGDSALLDSLWRVMRPGAALEVRLNASALAEAGWSLDAGGKQVFRVLAETGYTTRPPIRLDAAALRVLPSSWAKRLAYGRSPEALLISAKKGAGTIAGFRTS